MTTPSLSIEVSMSSPNQAPTPLPKLRKGLLILEGDLYLDLNGLLENHDLYLHTILFVLGFTGETLALFGITDFTSHHRIAFLFATVDM
ncbi:hypothetical protein VNO80_08692 [Phaseolus coccineus]|uniref:Uncharacterized protein n=1 Tax=Phaseolus coccineus TaxID=3886 RepID=A0AAN9R8U4_PHACN